MADNGRFEELEEIQKLDQVLAAAEINIHEFFAKKVESTSIVPVSLQSQGTCDFSNDQTISHFSISSVPGLNFPRFDGTNPRVWMIKFVSYFELRPSVNDRQKILIASMHCDGRASIWYQNLVERRVEMNWPQFLDLVSYRFEDCRVAKRFRELEDLKHVGSYSYYVNKFEELIWDIPMGDELDLFEDYFISRFISGLSDELRVILSRLQPKSLYDAMELGRKQLRVLDIIAKGRKTILGNSLDSGVSPSEAENMSCYRLCGPFNNLSMVGYHSPKSFIPIITMADIQMGDMVLVQAEINQPSSLIIYSLYNSKEISYRDYLIRNSLDALDKIRFENSLGIVNVATNFEARAAKKSAATIEQLHVGEDQIVPFDRGRWCVVEGMKANFSIWKKQQECRAEAQKYRFFDRKRCVVAVKMIIQRVTCLRDIREATGGNLELSQLLNQRNANYSLGHAEIGCRPWGQGRRRHGEIVIYRRHCELEVSRHSKQYLLLLLGHQYAGGLFRFIGAAGMTVVIANTYDLFTFVLFFALGAFVLARESVKKWWLWSYLSLSLICPHNAVLVNECQGHNWSRLVNGTRLGTLITESRGFSPRAYWYWIGVGACFEFIWLFNIFYLLTLTFLDHADKPQAVLFESSDDGVKTSGVASAVFGNASQRRSKSSSSSSITVDNIEPDKNYKREIIHSFEQHFITFDNIGYSVYMPAEMKSQGATDDRLQLLKGIDEAFMPGILTVLMSVCGEGALELLRILIYKVDGDGATIMSTHDRKASIREFYAVIYPLLMQLQSSTTKSEDKRQKIACLGRYKRSIGEELTTCSDSEVEREKECEAPNIYYYILEDENVLNGGVLSHTDWAMRIIGLLWNWVGP